MAVGLLARMEDAAAAAMDIDPSDGVDGGLMAEGVEADPPLLETPKKKRKSPAIPWKKPADMPRRPLSAYNAFFAAERRRLLETAAEGSRDDSSQSLSHDGSETSASMETERPKSPAKTGKMSFANLAKTVAAKWKTLDASERAEYEALAAIDKQRYDIAVAEWRAKTKKAKELSIDEKPSSDLLAARLPTPNNALPPTLSRDNLHLFGNDWDNAESSQVGMEDVPSVLSHATLEGTAGSRLQASSSSLWASHNSLDPNELSSEVEYEHGSSIDASHWDHTSATAGSSTFDLTAFSPLAQYVRRLPFDSENERMTSLGIPTIGEHEVAGARLGRSASLPLSSPVSSYSAPSRLPGYNRSYSTGMRFIDAYHPENLHVGLAMPAQRSASFSGALPPPPFRLHQTDNTAAHHDAALRRRHSVGAQFQGYPSTTQGRIPFHDASVEMLPPSMASTSSELGQRETTDQDINNLRRTLDSDMLDFLTDMSFPDLEESPNNPDNHHSS